MNPNLKIAIFEFNTMQCIINILTPRRINTDNIKMSEIKSRFQLLLGNGKTIASLW